MSALRFGQDSAPAAAVGALPRFRAGLRRPGATSPAAMRPVPAGTDTLAPVDALLLGHLRATGRVPPELVERASVARLRDRIPTRDSLLASGALDEAGLLDAMAAAYGGEARRGPLGGDAALIDRLGIEYCLTLNLLPLRRAGGAVLLATARPADALAQAEMLTSLVGRFRLVLAERAEVEAALLRARRSRLADQAELRIPADQSCRRWQHSRLGPASAVAAAVGLLLLWQAPRLVLTALTLWAIFTLAATSALKTATLLSALYRARRRGPPFQSCRTRRFFRPPPPRGAKPLPMISILVPLFREPEIAGRLIRRLGALSYPKERLEICLITEADDDATRAAIARVALPFWMRVVEVPQGPVQTKPRALNYAMSLCRGELVGIYDAEDAPESDQLHKVAASFASAPPEVVCLQGALDFYNPHQNWLSRLFTIEYATWFRLMLPGLARLGLVVPLGGTTLFFRRKALETIGGWDAWNVTEDADLGLRLARHGWRTELVSTVTFEEANCHLWPWIRQRSRWLKGYAMTWATHMRHPLVLWRQLGTWRFFGVQLLFLGTLSQYLLAPLLWSFWALPLGLAHPLLPVLGPSTLLVFGLAFFCAELINLAAALVALRGTRHRGLSIWVLAMHAYFPLGTIAAWRALAQTVTRPFYWDKTTHGLAPGTAG